MLPDPIAQVVLHLQAHFPQAQIEVDPPYSSTGEWFIDVSCGHRWTAFSWHQEQFGLYPQNASFGERPLRRVKHPQTVLEWVEQALRAQDLPKFCTAAKSG